MKAILVILLIPSIAFADGVDDLIRALQAHNQRGDVSPFIGDQMPVIVFPKVLTAPATNNTFTIQPPPLLLREQIISERVGAPTGNVFQDGVARGLHGAIVDYQMKHGR